MYIPNGFESDGTTLRFDVVTIESNKTASYGHDSSDLVWYHGNGIDLLPLGLVFSGSTAPSGNQYMLWYDTPNNQIKYTNNSGASWSAEQSLPLGVIATSSSAPTSIDQVFNGFSYIGSTMFALPGVKGLIPDGRNADGTLKNIEFTTDKVYIRSDDYPHDYTLVLSPYDLENFLTFKYDEEKNYNTGSSGEILNTRMNAGTLVRETSGVISNLQPKAAFNAVDYNDKSTISGWSMPSDRFLTLTIGTGGSSYTAPANGYFQLNGKCTANYQMVNIVGDSNKITTVSSSGNATTVNCYVPVRKGDIITVWYTATITNFMFVYASPSA